MREITAFKNKFVIINQDSGYLMIDIANALAESGNSISLVTGRLIERGNCLNPQVEIIRIIKYNRNTTLTRLSSWILASLQILFLIWFRFRKRAIIFTSNPPFAPIIPLLIRNRFSLFILDIYPDALYETGLLSERNPVIRIWQKANNLVFAKANHIYTLTEGMKSVLNKYAGGSEIEVIPVWADTGFLKPIPKKDNPFVREHGLENKFVVMYSGNLGLTHELEVLLEIAKGTHDERIVFLIIGEGEKKRELVKQADVSGLKNVRFMSYQPVEILPFSLAAADLAVVTLGRGSSMLSVPSKAYSFMAVGAPLLCIAEEGSELRQLVSKHHIGKCFNAFEINEITDFVNLMAVDEDTCNTFSSASLRASSFYSIANANRIKA